MPNLSSQEYYYKVQESYFRDSSSGMLDAYNHFQRSHCYNPQHVNIYSSHLGSNMLMDVDCGKCYHCRETKINSWVTRMYAHSEYFPYVYFVTLTYRPFYSLGDVSSLVFNKLNGALWHYDNLNANRRYGWNPCILCKRHYQLFLKRLRKRTKADITYVVSGEMGHNFGRPHFHLILFSKSPLLQSDIEAAWSIALWRDDSKSWSYYKNQKHHGKRFNFSIGRVQVDDLVENGSFNQAAQVHVDGQVLNAAKCFAYVCKYVCKGGDFNTTRLSLAYNSLFIDEKITTSYDDFYLKYIHMSEDEVRDYKFNKKLRFIRKNNLPLKVTYYEKIFKNDNQLYLDGVDASIFPKVWFDFKSSFSQFIEVSRGCPIGSLYANDHIDEFISGVFPKPLLQEQGFVVPSYFRQKAETKVYGLRFRRKTISGESFNQGNLPDFLEHCEKVRHGLCNFRYSVPIDIFNSRERIFQYNFRFKDLSTGETIIFPRYKGYVQAEYYRYNRSSRKYELSRIVSLDLFLSEYIPKMRESIKRFNASISLSKYNQSLQNRAAILLDEYGFTLRNLRQRFADKQTEYLNFRDATYNHEHKFVE